MGRMGIRPRAKGHYGIGGGGAQGLFLRKAGVRAGPTYVFGR